MKKARRIAVYMATGVLLLVASLFIDNILFDLVVSARNSFLDYVLGWAGHLISLVFVLLIVASVFMWEENKRDWVLPLWFSCLAAGILSYAVKFLVARERPEAIAEIFGLADFSFPSTHAALSFAAVPILDEEFPELKWFWIGFAALVSISRVYTGHHFVSDVIAGGLLGAGIGLLMVFAKRKYSILG